MIEKPDVFGDVLEFTKAFAPDQILPSPGNPTDDIISLRLNLVNEECDELCDACSEYDLIGIADALADLQYVLNGMAIAFGIDLRRVHTEVHRANMTKTGGVRREDGKVLKPANWNAPDIERILETQEPLG